MTHVVLTLHISVGYNFKTWSGFKCDTFSSRVIGSKCDIEIISEILEVGHIGHIVWSKCDIRSKYECPMWHGPMWHGPMWHGPMWHGPMWHGPMW